MVLQKLKFWERSNSPRLHATEDTTGAREGYDQRERLGYDAEEWSSTQWGLAWLADTYVLGEEGIMPKLSNPQATRAWNRHKVDPASQLTPREFSRVLLFAMVNEGEAFYQRLEGRLMPRGKPFKIHYDDKNIPTEYEWHFLNEPNVIAPAADVKHLFIPTRPGQKRGDDLYKLVRDIASEKRSFIFALIKLAKISSLLRLFHKRNAGNMYIGSDTTADDVPKEKTADIDFTKDGITEIGPRDEIISPNISAGPIRVMEVERAAGGAIGQPYGISRMQASRDYSDSSYSSARFASLIDSATWKRYQGKLLEAQEEVMVLWPGRALYEIADPEAVEWTLPRFPSVDPHRDAQVDKVYVELKVRSRQQVIRRLGEDPESTFGEIQEYEARFGSSGGQNNPAGGSPGDQPEQRRQPGTTDPDSGDDGDPTGGDRRLPPGA